MPITIAHTAPTLLIRKTAFERLIPSLCSLVLVCSMPITIVHTAPTLLIRKAAFERVGLTRAQLDEALNLTDDEFRVEGLLIAIGPLVGEDTLSDLIAQLEESGLVYYDDFFELSGNWPDWLRLFVMDAAR